MRQEQLLGNYAFAEKDYDLIEQQYLMLGDSETEDELLKFFKCVVSQEVSLRGTEAETGRSGIRNGGKHHGKWNQGNDCRGNLLL